MPDLVEGTPIATLASLSTTVGGGAVLVTASDGRVTPDGVTGLYSGDRRLLSHLGVTVPGHHCELLETAHPGPDRRLVHWLVRDEAGRQRALLSQAHHVDGGLRIELTLRARAGKVTLDVIVDIATDLGDLLRLRYGEPPPPVVPYELVGDRLVAADATVAAEVTGVDATLHPSGRLAWRVTATPEASPTVTMTVGRRSGRRSSPPRVADVEVAGDHRWSRAVASARADLAALHMRDAERGLSWIGAGAPWYMALFGRDALLTAHEALVLGTDHALDVLEALARYQGTTDDPRTGEAPGKVLHELRTGDSGVFGLAPWQPYFGSVDATPLFVMLLAEAWRWGADGGRVRALLPAARRAVAWCRSVAGTDPRGHVTYDPGAVGLANHGWKDSAGAMVHADGADAPPPIAVVEAQGYHWRALRDLADLEAHLGDVGRAEALRVEADAVRAGVLDAFRADGCVVAMARDGQGRRLEVPSSNAGHLLWVGMLDTVEAEALADRLTAADMDGGWGLRTLSSAAVGYDPLSYHRGSIWPHDTALVADGIARAGRRTSAANLVDGVLRLAEHGGWRLPEVVAGYGVDEVDAPVPYPTTCSPQAWSAAVPLALLRTLLRLDPDVPAGRVRLGPALREDVTLTVTGIRLGTHRLDVSLDRGRISARTDAPLAVVVRDDPDASSDAP